MSRRSLTPTLRKHSNGNAYCKWRGIFHYFGPWRSPDMAKWKAFLRDIEQPEEPVELPTTAVTIADLLAAYIKAKEEWYSGPEHAENLNKYRFRWKHAFGPLLKLYGNTLVTDFGPKTFKQVRAKFVGNDRSRTYINDLACEIRLAFQWGVTEELVPISVFESIRLVKILRPGEFAGMPEGKEVKPVPIMTVRATLPFLAPPVAAIIELMTLTVSRPGEIAKMTAAQIDKNGPDGTWVYRPVKHKMSWKSKKRFLILNKEAQAILQKWWTPRGPLFVNSRTGEPYTTEQVRKAVDFACRRAGIPYWHPHQIRHEKYSEVSRQHGDTAAALLAGHSSTRMGERYDHSKVEKAAKFAG